MGSHVRPHFKEMWFLSCYGGNMTKTKLTRRSVMQTGAVAGAGLALPTILTAGSHSGLPMLQPVQV